MVILLFRNKPISVYTTCFAYFANIIVYTYKPLVASLEGKKMLIILLCIAGLLKQADGDTWSGRTIFCQMHSL